MATLNRWIPGPFTVMTLGQQCFDCRVGIAPGATAYRCKDGEVRCADPERWPDVPLSLAAELALAQEASYQARQPARREETAEELARRGCAYHTSLRPGQRIYEGGAILGQDEHFMIIEQVPVTILSGGEPDTTSDVFGRTLTRYRARNELTGREGNLTFGARGVVRVETMLPYAPLAAEAAQDAAQLAAWDTDGGH